MVQRQTSHDINILLQDVSDMEATELKAIYGIIIEADGFVFDVTNDAIFSSITEWVINMVDEDGDDVHASFRENFKSKSRYDDDTRY